MDEQQRRGVGRSLVHVVKPHVARLDEAGLEWERAAEIVEPIAALYTSRPTMTTEAQTRQATGLHGGRLVAKRLKAHGVTKLFTLSGGHLFSIYDGCREEGIDIVDVRHEQSAAFAAEGWAKATREPGVCALTAGPGVTNGMSAMARRRRTARRCWRSAGARPRCAGAGLAAGDRPRAVRRAADEARAHGRLDRRDPRPGRRGARRRGAPPSGPAFIDFPLDHVFMEGDVDAGHARPRRPIRWPAPAAAALERAAELLRGARSGR